MRAESTGRQVSLLLTIVAAAFAVIQFFPTDQYNPPESEIAKAPPKVRAVLDRSCADCHSNRTRWPWYARIAPASWLVARDVSEGRAAMNLSEWDLYEEDEQVDFVDLIGELARDGEMPPWFYLPLHPEARLDEDAISVLEDWSLTFEPVVR
jgi:hypothetical protein